MAYRHSGWWAAAAAGLVSVWIVAPPVVAAGQATAPIVNGVPSSAFPSVGLLTYEGVECTATLIGCRTVVTAAHCLCYDVTAQGFGLLFGDKCRERPDVWGPDGKHVFFQHAGYFDVTEVSLHPDWGPHGGVDDVALLRLDRPVTGIRPSAIDRQRLVPVGTTGTVVGFGRTHPDLEDQSIKRYGTVTTSATECSDGLICWQLDDPLGPAGTDTGICYNDSGGPLFIDFGSGPVIAGLSSSATTFDCQPPATEYSTEIYPDRDWILATGGADLRTEVCGPLSAVQEPGSRTFGFFGSISGARRSAELPFEVPPGTRVLRVALNTAGAVRPPTNDFDLFVQHGSPPEPDTSADCAAMRPEGLESCQVELPAPGTWYARIERRQGSGPYQIVVSQFDGEAGPPPPDGPWLTSPDLPGFELKARLGEGAGLPAALEDDCIPESVCLSGALPGRSEAFVKVIGPRPNGYLWLQASRFTPSRVELWVRQPSSGRINHYVLPAVDAAVDDVSGLQDRTAFEP